MDKGNEKQHHLVLFLRGGERGIRTLAELLAPYRFSKPAPSASWVSLHAPTMVTASGGLIKALLTILPKIRYYMLAFAKMTGKQPGEARERCDDDDASRGGPAFEGRCVRRSSDGQLLGAARTVDQDHSGPHSAAARQLQGRR